MFDRQIRWNDLITIVHRRRRVVWRVFWGGVALVAITLVLLGPRYPATAILMVTAERAHATVSPDAGSGSAFEPPTDEDLNSEVALLRGEPLLREVLAANRDVPRPRGFAHAAGRVVTAPFRAVDAVYRRMHGIPPPTELDAVVARTARHLTVEPVRKSSLIRVSLDQRGVDPAWSARLVNDLVARHMEVHRDWSRQPEAVRFFEVQRAMLQERAAAAESALLAFHQWHGLDTLPEQRVAWRTRLANLKTQLADAETEFTERSARVVFLTEELARHPRDIPVEERLAQNQAVQYLKPKVLEKELQLNTLRSTYAPTSLKVRDVERELLEARRLLRSEKEMVVERRTAVNPTWQALEGNLAEARVQLAAWQARVDVVRRQIDESTDRVGGLEAVVADQQRLEQEATTAREALLNYTRKQEEARVSTALDQSRIVNITVARPAAPAPTPAPAHTLLLFALGLLASLLAALAAGFVYDRLDPTVRDAADVAQTAGVPVFAELS